MNTERLNCVLCKSNFQSKEDLQIHFRKHGDPNFDKSTKAKNRSLSDNQNASEKLAVDNEKVGCDVCDELFPTISKAITHKHKVHPDHDAKYFCPFCGKLFTMKHLYNKHIQLNHDTQTSIEKSDFHCDSCEVMFFAPSAMLYHNKFFHRQDSEIPSIGSSKKVKLCSKEFIQIYYCTFCGEEYNNKVNLHKHMGDDHADENQSPTDVLKCPLCEAIFYHLDAYELHLMFHSSEDTYSESNEMAEKVTEFSLETVPPIVEKIEEECAQEDNASAEEGMSTVMKFLMGDTIDSEVVGKIKTKKHKKHKKSKKAAITLDEFLNMNKDVFGDGLDIQGIEEVPTQMVLKKIKGNKTVNTKSKAISADINKLKRQGIIVKTKSGNNLNTNIVRHINTNSTTTANKIENQKCTTVSAPDELLSKLMRQGNSEIKIVKKSSNLKEDDLAQSLNDNTLTGAQSEDDNEGLESGNSKDEREVAVSSNEVMQQHEDTLVKNESKDLPSTNEGTNNELTISSNDCDSEYFPVNFNSNISEETSISDCSGIPSGSKDKDNESPITSPCTHNEENSSDLDTPDKTINSKYDDLQGDCSSNSAIGALKHLSHLITIKPVKQEKNQELLNDLEKQPITKNENINPDFDLNKLESTNIKNNYQHSTSQNKSEQFKNFGKNLIVKSTSQNFSGGTNDCEIEKLSIINKDTDIEENNSSGKNILKIVPNDWHNKNQSVVDEPNINSELHNLPTNVTVKQIKNPKQVVNTSSTNVKIDKPIDKHIDNEIEIFNIDDSDSDDDFNDAVGSDNNEGTGIIKDSLQLQDVLHSLGSNITIKSSQQKSTIGEVKTKISKDDSSVNNDIHTYKKVNKPSPEIQKSINLQNTLKNLGSHITIKSKSASSIFTDKEYKTFDDDKDGEFTDAEHNDQNYSDSETELGKVNITEMSNVTSDVENETDKFCNTVALVQSPAEENSESEYNSHEDDSDIEVPMKASTLKKSEGLTSKLNLQSNVKHFNKNFLNKPLNDSKISPETTAYDINNISTDNSSTSVSQGFGHSSQLNALNRKVNTSSNEINTVKTVKKFQTETVIQEVTTVTRTIRTVNESTNEIMQTGNNSATSQKMIKNQLGREYQGKTIRHIAPTVGTRIRCAGNKRPANFAPIRSPNQIVPIRNISNAAKLPGPGMQIIRKTVPPLNSPQTLTPNKFKISPNIINQTTVKRPLEGNSSVTSGITKKSKESTIAMQLPKNNVGSAEHYTASTSNSEFSSVTKVVKGKSLVTQTRSEVNTSTQQHLNKLNNMSGLKVIKTSMKQAMEVVEKSGCINESQRNTLNAIEKLQKQGLLVKKPRLDNSNEHDYFSESDDEMCDQ